MKQFLNEFEPQRNYRMVTASDIPSLPYLIVMIPFAVVAAMFLAVTQFSGLFGGSHGR